MLVKTLGRFNTICYSAPAYRTRTNPLIMRIVKKIVFIGALFITLNLNAHSAFAGIFTDVNDNYPYLPAIRYLKENGVIKGYEDGSFQPKQEVNRAEALKIITLGNKILGEKVASGDAERLFDLESGLLEPTTDAEREATKTVDLVDDFDLVDVTEDTWFYKYVKQAFKKGIIKGYNDRTFRPSNTVNLAEAVKMLLETNGVELPTSLEKDPYADVSMDAWYAPYIQYAKSHYVLISDMDKRIYPDSNITRVELANLLYRFYTMQEGRTYGRSSYYADYFEGKGTASGEKFTQNNYTAAHLTLPFGTLVKVVNIETEKSIVVRINDRGPYDDRFVLDLSKSAFEAISPLSRGVIQIYFEIIYKP